MTFWICRKSKKIHTKIDNKGIQKVEEYKVNTSTSVVFLYTKNEWSASEIKIEIPFGGLVAKSCLTLRPQGL